jgi:signal transduction histidine kinase
VRGTLHTSERLQSIGATDAPPVRLPIREAVTLGIVLWIPVWIVVLVLAALHSHLQADRLVGLGRILGSSSMLLAAGVGVLCLGRWRLMADPRDLHIGVAVLAFGVLHSGVVDLVTEPFENHLSSVPLQVVAAAGFVLAFAALAGPTARSVIAPESRRRRAGAMLLVLGALVAIAVSPSARAAMTGYRVPGLGVAAQVVAQLTVAALWVVVAAAFWRWANDDGRAVDVWVAAMLLAFAQCRVMLALTTPLGTGAAIGSQVLRLTGILLVVAGLSREFHRGLLWSQTMVHSLLHQRREDEAAREEQRHDARAAFFSIGSTLDSLSRHLDTIDRKSLEELTVALSAETGRLRRLLVDQKRDGIQQFRVAEALGPLVVCERAVGQALDVEVVGDPVAEGRPADTAEVVRNLLDNARIHAPGSPVHVRVERVGLSVIVTVADEGLGVPGAERRTIFGRGHRGAGAIAPGNGLGLYLASRLMRDQDGDIAVESAPGGGAAFMVRLPAAPARVIAMPDSRLRIEDHTSEWAGGFLA